MQQRIHDEPSYHRIDGLLRGHWQARRVVLVRSRWNSSLSKVRKTDMFL